MTQSKSFHVDLSVRVVELRGLGKKYRIKNYKSLKKADLVANINEAMTSAKIKKGPTLEELRETARSLKISRSHSLNKAKLTEEIQRYKCRQPAL